MGIIDRGLDIRGFRFGKLVAIEPHSFSERGHIKYLCQCDCGKTSISFKFSLMSKKKPTTSCGCVSAEKSKSLFANMSEEDKLAKFSRPTHGMSKSREFQCWSDIKGRCLNTNNRWYPSYGGRGITVCDSWLNSFENFYKDMGECPPKFSLDRVDVNGNYCKENCRWATAKQQQRNRTDTEWIDSPLGYHPVADVAEMLGLTTSCLKHRLSVGWSWEKITSKPSQRKSKEK